mmetsp:Transcript_10269/g.13780  ORF Transcript_10269/g.13780 Transcript_10269/m.13780 type:complete len:127 (-) Transcript_10269:17-397(-)
MASVGAEGPVKSCFRREAADSVRIMGFRLLRRGVRRGREDFVDVGDSSTASAAAVLNDRGVVVLLGRSAGTTDDDEEELQGEDEDNGRLHCRAVDVVPTERYDCCVNSCTDRWMARLRMMDCIILA